MSRIPISIALLLLLLTPGLLASGVTYSYWEGPGIADTVAVDDSPATADLWWANQFFTQPGGEGITSITLAFGPRVVTGRPVSFMVYDDPDGNGLPNDLTWLGQIDTVFPAYNPPPGSINSLFTVNFPTPVQVGTSFFIAALMLNATSHPCTPPDAPGTCWEDIRAEITNPHGRSWIAANESNPGTFN